MNVVLLRVLGVLAAVSKWAARPYWRERFRLAMVGGRGACDVLDVEEVSEHRVGLVRAG